MAQFDVFVNPGRKNRKSYPFILDIQNPLIEDITTRIVVPLANYHSFKNEELKGLTPKVSFNDQDLLIMIPQIASIPKNILNEPVGSLILLRDEIIAALDFAITGI